MVMCDKNNYKTSVALIVPLIHHKKDITNEKLELAPMTSKIINVMEDYL